MDSAGPVGGANSFSTLSPTKTVSPSSYKNEWWRLQRSLPNIVFYLYFTFKVTVLEHFSWLFLSLSNPCNLGVHSSACHLRDKQLAQSTCHTCLPLWFWFPRGLVYLWITFPTHIHVPLCTTCIKFDRWWLFLGFQFYIFKVLTQGICVWSGLDLSLRPGAGVWAIKMTHNWILDITI